MLEPLVSAAFWILFPIGCLLAAARLAGVGLQNHRLSAARWHVDDGLPAGTGYEVYRLTVVSGRLAWAAAFLAVAHLVVALIGAIGSGWTRAAALMVSAGLVLLADRLRDRHARLERSFEREVGMPLGTFYRDMHEGETTLA